MQPQKPRFSLAELVDASGVPERTIRQYITDGLIPASLGRGRSRYYTPDHLARLELVARLRTDRLSIDEIRERLNGTATSPGPDGANWQRLTFHPDLELHIRNDAPESVQALARELANEARRWFGNE